MDKRIKTQWVKDLRSGKFEQGQGQLYDVKNNQYCCLGVLAKKVAPRLIGTGEGSLDPKALKLCGLTEVEQEKLIGWNDGKKNGESVVPWSFKKIAYYIERYL